MPIPPICCIKNPYKYFKINEIYIEKMLSSQYLKYFKLKDVKYSNFISFYMFYNIKIVYLCIVFFMVLDLRLIEDWVVVRQPFFF